MSKVAVLGSGSVGQVLADDGADVLLAGEELFVAEDLGAELVVLLEDLVALQGGELAELQTHDRLGLGLAHAVDVLGADFALQGGEVGVAEGPFQDGGGDFQVLQARLRLGPARRRPADLDHLVQRRDGDELYSPI